MTNGETVRPATTLAPTMRRIAVSAAVLLVLQGVHSLDHLLLQNRDLAPAVGALGVLESAAVVLTLVLARRADDAAPMAAVLAGGGTALAFVVVHLVPEWGFLSDPYADASLDAASWLIMFAGLAGGIALAWTGFSEMRRGRLLAKSGRA